MIKSKQYADAIQEFIENKKTQLNIDLLRYKIIIRIDFSISVILFVDIDYKNDEIPESKIFQSEDDFISGFCEFLDEELRNDGPYDISPDGNRFIPNLSVEIFCFAESRTPINERMLAQGDGVEFGAKYRLSSLLNDSVKRVDAKKWGNIPVITFYSYKGGMGRTTTMMAYAMFLAAKGKKVAVVDCDLEAPGYLNFFDLSNQEDLRNGERNGLVEYLSDYAFVNGEEDFLNFSSYLVVPPIGRYPADDFLQNIEIMPGGNLNIPLYNTNSEDKASESRRIYIEGLSRLNLANTETTIEGFGSVFSQLYKRGADVILLDSRTGLNDIFGTIALSMSDAVVGFFGFSDQTMPGVRELGKAYSLPNTDFELFIVTNLLPPEASETWKQQGIEKISAAIFDELKKMTSEKQPPQHYCLKRLPILEKVGTGDESADAKLINIVKDFTTPDRALQAIDEIGQMGELFEDLSTSINLFEDHNIGELESKKEVVDNSNWGDIRKESTFAKQKYILKSIKNKLRDIKPFAESTAIRPNLFYFRKWMAEFFNPNKFLILGSKGAGKSMFYRALGDSKYEETKHLIMQATKKFEGPESSLGKISEFICINAFSLYREEDFNLLFERIPENRRRNFWVLYTWNAILSHPDLKDIKELSLLKDNLFDPISNDGFDKIQKLIDADFGFFAKIDKDLSLINDKLTRENKKLLILYDGLDNINPNTWSSTVSPLVDYWRDRINRYDRIDPKIFIRTDLIEYLQGTNTMRLKENVINIDWSIEEVFGFFFKLLLADEDVRNRTWNVLLIRDPKYKIHIETIKHNIDQELNQIINPTKALLKPLVVMVFGEKIIYAKNIDSWSFFKTSLSNASGGISLRPFINLVNEHVLQKAIEDPDRHPLAIIPSKYYATKENRDTAANEYFNDLVNGDKYISDIKYVHDYLTGYEGEPFKYIELEESRFDQLLINTLNTYKNEIKNSNTITQLRDKLTAAGVVKMKPGRPKLYIFADMYKYTWGLKTPERWEQGTIVEGKYGMRVRERDGKNISFSNSFNYNLLNDFRIGQSILYRKEEIRPDYYKVVSIKAK